MDVAAIQQAAIAEEQKRIRSIRESPLGFQMRPLASYLAFDTHLSARESLTILWFAAESIRATHGIAPNETEMRAQ